jgi:hypothetical protein
MLTTIKLIDAKDGSTVTSDEGRYLLLEHVPHKGDVILFGERAWVVNLVVFADVTRDLPYTVRLECDETERPVSAP